MQLTETENSFINPLLSWLAAIEKTRPHIRGQIQPVFLGGWFQLHLAVKSHYGFTNAREMKYTSQHYSDKTMDAKCPYYANDVFPIVQNHGKKDTFAAFRGGRSPQSPLPWICSFHTSKSMTAVTLPERIMMNEDVKIPCSSLRFSLVTRPTPKTNYGSHISLCRSIGVARGLIGSNRSNQLKAGPARKMFRSCYTRQQNAIQQPG